MRNSTKRRSDERRTSRRHSERTDNWAQNYRHEESPEPRKRLYRSRSKIVGGVCGGIANYFGIDRTIVRVGAFIVLLVYTIPTLIAYFVLCLCLDVEPNRSVRSLLSDDEDDGDVWTRMRDNPGAAFREVGRRVRNLENRSKKTERGGGSRENLRKAFRDL